MSAQMSDPGLGPAELVLTATAARRYYLDEASKSDIATELGVSRFKVARLLRLARASGLVKIELDYRGEIDLDLSVRLRQTLGLQHALVIDFDDEADPVQLRAHLGRAAAGLLSEITTVEDVLGLACGRSLMAMRTALASLPPCVVVQMTGAISEQDLAESSIELVRDVAAAGGGTGFYFYAPMVMPDAATASALWTQHDVARTAERFGSLTKAVVGVGGWAARQSTVADMVDASERRALHAAGVRAEVCGIGIDEDGTPVGTELSHRRIGIGPEELRAVPEVIAIAYGVAKAPAVRASVRGGFVKSVVTHAGMAKALIDGG